jgi:hypothetical protein
MSVLKTAGVFGVIGGVGLIGYYLLNKYKPTISEQQTFDIKGEGYVLILDTPEHRKIWSIVAQYGYDNLGQDNRYLTLKKRLLTQNPLLISTDEYVLLSRSYMDINEKGVYEEVLGSVFSKYDNSKFQFKKRTQGIADERWTSDEFGKGLGYSTNCEYNPFKETNPCAYNYGVPFKGNDYWRYAPNESGIAFRSPPSESGLDISLIADDCVELDRDMKRLTNRIAEQTKNEPNEDKRRVLAWYQDILEDAFQLHNCRDKIEKQRLLDFAKTQTLSAIKAEDSVLGKSKKDENLYLGLGALIIVLSASVVMSGGKSSSGTSSTSSNGNSDILSNLIIFGGLTGMGYLIFKKPKVVLPSSKN